MPLENENPFEYVSRIVSKEDSSFVIETLKKHYSLSQLEAKSVLLTCPVYQEKFCRNRIYASKKRGGSEYGNKVFLRRRYKLNEEELEYIFDELWMGKKDNVSRRFLKILSPLRISKGHLTDGAQRAIEKLIKDYGHGS